MKVSGFSRMTRSPPIVAFGGLALETSCARAGPVVAGDGVHGHEADIVPVAGVARTGIAEADEEQHGADPAANPPERIDRARAEWAGRKALPVEQGLRWRGFLAAGASGLGGRSSGAAAAAAGAAPRPSGRTGRRPSRR